VGNLTHINSQIGKFSPDWVDQSLQCVNKKHFNDAIIFEQQNEAWIAKDKEGNIIFDFYLEFPARLGFYYSRYGAWGDWARLVTIEELAVMCQGKIWDDCEGEGVKWDGDPDKYSPFNKYVKRHLRYIPKGLRTIYRVLAWASKPRGQCCKT
jgi:hypothetical protein